MSGAGDVIKVKEGEGLRLPLSKATSGDTEEGSRNPGSSVVSRPG